MGNSSKCVAFITEQLTHIGMLNGRRQSSQTNRNRLGQVSEQRFYNFATDGIVQHTLSGVFKQSHDKAQRYQRQTQVVSVHLKHCTFIAQSIVRNDRARCRKKKRNRAYMRAYVGDTEKWKFQLERHKFIWARQTANRCVSVRSWRSPKRQTDFSRTFCWICHSQSELSPGENHAALFLCVIFLFLFGGWRRSRVPYANN